MQKYCLIPNWANYIPNTATNGRIYRINGKNQRINVLITDSFEEIEDKIANFIASLDV